MIKSLKTIPYNKIYKNCAKLLTKTYTKESCKLCGCTRRMLGSSFSTHLTTCLRNKHTTSKIFPKNRRTPSDTTYIKENILKSGYFYQRAKIGNLTLGSISLSYKVSHLIFRFLSRSERFAREVSFFRFQPRVACREALE